MHYLLTIIYDLTRKAEFSYILLFSALLATFGAIVFLNAVDYEEEENFATRFLMILKEKLIHTKKESQFFGIALLVIALFICSYHTLNYLNYKKPQWFKEVKVSSGRIDKIETKEIMGVSYISFNLNNITFTILRDKCYISMRNLVNSDSIHLEYYQHENNNSKLEAEKTIVKIELVD